MRRRALPITLAGALAAAVLTVVTACAGPSPSAPAVSPRAAATATPTSTPDPFPRRPLTASTRYVALGDSFAAGMGGGGETGKCRSSSASYPDVFTREAGIDLIVNAACSGATTSDLLRKQLIALDDRTDLVTVSIGGNDLGVAAIAADCAAGKAVSCRSQLTSALSLLNVLPERLETVYDAIVQAAPNARIVVTGYALMYDASDPQAKDFGMAAAINAATIGLNQVIDDAVDAERAKGAPMTYIGVDFAGHAIGDDDPWVHTSGVDAFHPTADGYAEYAKQLVRRLGTAG
jgi:lysophospholipase L1-like esterase